jgi:hypothetical protein
VEVVAMDAISEEVITIVFDDAYTGERRYGRVIQTNGSDAIVRSITKDEAGSNPIEIKPRPDPRISAITGGTGVIAQ